MSGIVALGCAVALLGACVSIPQTLRMLRHRDSSGLSMTSCVALALSWTLWAGYSASAGAWPKFASEVLGFVMEVTLVVTVAVVAGWSGLRRVGTSLAIVLPGVVTVCAVGHVFGPLAFIIALGLFDAAYLIPQIRTSMNAPSLASLSAASYGLRALTAAGWVAYGFALGRPELGGWGFVIAPIAATVSIKIYLDQRKPAAEVHALPVRAQSNVSSEHTVAVSEDASAFPVAA